MSHLKILRQDKCRSEQLSLRSDVTWSYFWRQKKRRKWENDELLGESIVNFDAINVPFVCVESRYKRIGSIVLGDNNTRIRVLSTILVYNLYTSIVKKKLKRFVRRDNYIYRI